MFAQQALQEEYQVVALQRGCAAVRQGWQCLLREATLQTGLAVPAAKGFSANPSGQAGWQFLLLRHRLSRWPISWDRTGGSTPPATCQPAAWGLDTGCCWRSQ